MNFLFQTQILHLCPERYYRIAETRVIMMRSITLNLRTRSLLYVSEAFPGGPSLLQAKDVDDFSFLAKVTGISVISASTRLLPPHVREHYDIKGKQVLPHSGSFLYRVDQAFLYRRRKLRILVCCCV